MAHPDTLDWGAIKADYLAGEMTVDAICAKHDVVLATLYSRARRDGWALRTSNAAVERNQIIARMFRVLDKQIILLEGAMKQSDEKEAKLLGSLANTLEKLIAIENGERKGRHIARQSKEMTELKARIAQRMNEITGRV